MPRTMLLILRIRFSNLKYLELQVSFDQNSFSNKQNLFACSPRSTVKKHTFPPDFLAAGLVGWLVGCSSVAVGLSELDGKFLCHHSADLVHRMWGLFWTV